MTGKPERESEAASEAGEDSRQDVLRASTVRVRYVEARVPEKKCSISDRGDTFRVHFSFLFFAVLIPGRKAALEA